MSQKQVTFDPTFMYQAVVDKEVDVITSYSSDGRIAAFDLLVLDDPLSALDVNTEELVEARLREVLADTTTLIVAHRPSTVALADRVALLEDGRISAVGTHTELLAENSHYRYVIASLDPEPRDLDSELSALEAEEVSR